MIDDRLQIDGFNPYTWSGTYGVSHDGFPKNVFIDGSYTSAISERPMEVTAPVENPNDPNLHNSGPMYLKTASVDPAPFRGFPARKLEYSDGTTTWYRPGAPWSWMGGRSAAPDDSWTTQVSRSRNNNMLLWIALAIFAYILYTKLR